MIYLDLGGTGPGLVPLEEAALPVTDRGFLYGDGLFETVLVRDGATPLLPLHLARLEASAGALGIPYERDRITAAARALAEQAGAGEHAMRITLSRGSGGRRGYEPPPGGRPTLLITTAPYRRPTGPLAAIIATLRANPDSPLTRHKTLSALEKVLARAEAANAGADEALLLNTAGRLAEGAATNLFVRVGDRWFTPSLSEGCLPGVMRGQMIALTGAEERPISLHDLWEADGAYVTNSLMGCMALGSLDGRPLRQPAALPSLKELLA